MSRFRVKIPPSNSLTEMDRWILYKFTGLSIPTEGDVVVDCESQESLDSLALLLDILHIPRDWKTKEPCDG